MKYWGVLFVLLLVACSTPQPQMLISTETAVPKTATPRIIQVTRVVKIEQTVVITVTPELLRAQACFDSAATQSDLNSCAAEERFRAQTQLEETISRIKFSSEDKQQFDKLEKEWEDVIERNCMFYYDKWGSMRPMQQSMCIAQRIKERIKELELTYLTPDG